VPRASQRLLHLPPAVCALAGRQASGRASGRLAVWRQAQTAGAHARTRRRARGARAGAGGGVLAGRRPGGHGLARRHLVRLGPGRAPLAAGGPEEAAAGARAPPPQRLSTPKPTLCQWGRRTRRSCCRHAPRPRSGPRARARPGALGAARWRVCRRVKGATHWPCTWDRLRCGGAPRAPRAPTKPRGMHRRVERLWLVPPPWFIPGLAAAGGAGPGAGRVLPAAGVRAGRRCGGRRAGRRAALPGRAHRPPAGGAGAAGRLLVMGLLHLLDVADGAATFINVGSTSATACSSAGGRSRPPVDRAGRQIGSPPASTCVLVRTCASPLLFTWSA